MAAWVGRGAPKTSRAAEKGSRVYSEGNASVSLFKFGLKLFRNFNLEIDYSN